MKCPRCGADMVMEGIPHVVGSRMFVTWQCPACGFSFEKPHADSAEKPQQSDAYWE